MLRANEGLSSPGVKLHGDGFIVTRQEAEHLGLGRLLGSNVILGTTRNGRDLASTPRDVMAIDLLGLEADEVRERYPLLYQHILGKVKSERDVNRRATYTTNWWIFGEPRRE